MRRTPRLHRAHGARRVPFAFDHLVSRRTLQLVEQSEVRVHGLKVRRVGLAQIPIQRPVHARRRRHHGFAAAQHPVEVDRRQETGGRALRVSLDTGDLAGEQHLRIVAQRQVRRERRGRIDVRVPVDRSVTQELCVGEAGNRAEYALLFRNPEPRLESHEVPHPAGAVFAPQLYHRVRTLAGVGIGDPDRLHRPEPQRLASAPGHLFGRHAALEIGRLVELVRRELVGGRERVDECFVLFPVHRAVEVRARRILGALHCLLVPARSAKRHALVDALRGNDGSNGIVERQRLDAQPSADRLAERVAGERSGGDDGRRCREGGHLATLHPDPRVGHDPLVHPRGEQLAVHRECAAGRHARLVSGHEDHRPEFAHLGLEQAVGVGDLGALERVGADELGEPVGLVSGSAQEGAHLAQDHVMAARRELPGGLAPSQATADDLNHDARSNHPSGGVRLAGHLACQAVTGSATASAGSATLHSLAHLRHLR